MLALPRRLLLSFSLFLVILLTPTAHADTLEVEDGLFFFGSADVLDDVVIRNGGILLLDGTLVTGHVRVEQGGALLASNSLFQGQVRANQALLIDLSQCSFDRDVDLIRTGGNGNVFGILPQIAIFQCQIAGDLKIARSSIESLLVTNNQIEGKLDLSRNRTVRPAVVENNVVLGRRNCR